MLHFFRMIFAGGAVLLFSTLATAGMPTDTKFDVENIKDKAFVDSIDSQLPHLLNLINSPGMNIAVARRGKVIWQGAYGYSDAYKKDPMRIDSVFRAGSMGKVYTAVAIMQLVERGVLDLNDPINSYLPFEVINPIGGDDIRIIHLMTHTSGLAGDAAGSVFADPRPLEVALREKYEKEMQPLLGGYPTWTKKPGEAHQYSNIGVATLGLIVQKANPEGLSYSDYIEENIFQLLEMKSSQFPTVQTKEQIKPELWKRMTKGYNAVGSMWIETPIVYLEEFPAGGLISIPRDHLKLLMALMNGGELGGRRILEKATVDMMLSEQVDASLLSPYLPNSEDRQGLIWWLRDWNSDSASFYHGGAHMYGWKAMGIAWPKYEQTAVVVAFNEWTSQNEKRYRIVEDFIQQLLLAEASASLNGDVDFATNEEMAWKSSYLLGLLFVESYRYGIGIGQQVDEIEMQRIAKQALPASWSGVSNALWDEAGFLMGVSDMNAALPTKEGIRAFAQSEQMQITLEEARQLMPLIGAPGAFANLAGLLLE